MEAIKLILLYALLFQFGTSALAQPPPPPIYLYEEAQDQKIDSLIYFNTETNKFQYLALLPSINYNFLDKTFNVGISVSNLSSFYQNKQRNKIELEKLKFQLIEKKENDILALEREYELLIDSYDILKLELENSSLTNEIFLLKKAQYENNKINLEEWLNVQKIYQARKLTIIVKSKSLISKMKYFQTKIQNPCFANEINYLSTHNFEN